MAKLTPEQFADGVSQALGGRLVSLLLYGSAASGTHVPGRSDVNTLLICDAVDEGLFVALEPALARWVRAGNPAPLILAEREWRASADAFAIEYEEIRHAHRVLAGRDPWAGISVRREDLRRQLESELMGKLVRLRQLYAAFRSDPKRLTQVIVGSTAGVFTMLRTALRLAGRTAPAAPEDLVRQAAAVIGFPPESLEDVVAHVRGRSRLALAARDPRAAAYLAAVARTAEFVNTLS